MPKRSAYPKGIRDINQALKGAGHTQFRLMKQEGRFQFNGPHTNKWPESKVNVRHLDQLSVKEWLDEFNGLKEQGDAAIDAMTNPELQPGHSVPLGFAQRGMMKPKESRTPHAQRRIDEVLVSGPIREASISGMPQSEAEESILGFGRRLARQDFGDWSVVGWDWYGTPSTISVLSFRGPDRREAIVTFKQPFPFGEKSISVLKLGSGYSVPSREVYVRDGSNRSYTTVVRQIQKLLDELIRR